jgi:putative methylase
MKKSQLAIKLSKVEEFQQPKISLEQYITPPQLAADILHTSWMQGCIEGKKVVDLGTGTGIFAIGAVLLGAKEVVAVEKDEDAIQIAKQNAENLGVESEIKFIKSDIEDFESTCDTVVMNPPFSVHSDIDIGFIQKAIELGDSVYSVSHPGARKSIKDFVANSDHVLEALEEYKISLPPTYGFHTEENRETQIDVLITRKR